MIAEVVRVVIDGRPADDLVPDITTVDVEESVDLADVFAIRLAVVTRPDGSWSHVDDPRLEVWKRVTVEAGYQDALETVIDGYVTNVEVYLSGDQEPYVEIAGMDATALMDVEEKQTAWPDKADHEIAREVFNSYGLRPEIEDTAQHTEAVSTVLQSETDIRFVRRLAARNGFECHVKGKQAFFRSPNLQDPPQKAVALGAGEDASVTRITARVDGTPATAPEIRRVDPFEKQEDVKQLTETPRRKLGASTLAELRQVAPDGRVLVRHQAPSSVTEMEARLRGAYEAANRFVDVEGEIDGRAYRAVLRARGLVTLKGLGERLSGLYYVTRVRHTFTVDGYTQRFAAYRNGLGPKGDEGFGVG